MSELLLSKRVQKVKLGAVTQSREVTATVTVTDFANHICLYVYGYRSPLLITSLNRCKRLSKNQTKEKQAKKKGGERKTRKFQAEAGSDLPPNLLSTHAAATLFR